MLNTPCNHELTQQWDTVNTGRHLYEIQRERSSEDNFKKSTKEENILTRLRVGHTMLE